MCGNEIRNKKFSLVFTSVALLPKHGESEESPGKVWENKTFQGQMFLTYFARSRNPYNFQNSKHWNSECTYYGKIMGKHKYSKDLVFLYIPYYSILAWHRNPYNSENMGKLNSHSKGKVWENTNIPKLWVSYIFHVWH